LSTRIDQSAVWKLWMPTPAQR